MKWVWECPNRRFFELFSAGSSGQINSVDDVPAGLSFVDGDGVGGTITGVNGDTGTSTGGVERKDGRDGDVEGLKEDLGHLFSILLEVHGSLSDQSRMLFGSDSKPLEEGVVPDFFHVFH